MRLSLKFHFCLFQSLVLADLIEEKVLLLYCKNTFGILNKSFFRSLGRAVKSKTSLFVDFFYFFTKFFPIFSLGFAGIGPAVQCQYIHPGGQMWKRLLSLCS